MERQPPKIGVPILDNLLAATWAALAAANFWVTPSVFANISVGIGALATLLLTLLRVYEHLVGETVSETLSTDSSTGRNL